MNLDIEQLKALASSHFDASDVPTAAAIAMAESSGNPDALGDTLITTGGSVGLWQVNLRWHPEYTADQLRDPVQNAAAAFKVYTEAGNSFEPWSTFKSGAYKEYLS